MKKTSLAVTTLLSSLLALSITPITYAEDANSVAPVNADAQFGATTCDKCKAESCLCNTPNNNLAPDTHTNDGTPPVGKDGQLGATNCKGCNQQSCLCGDSSNDSDVTPIPANKEHSTDASTEIRTDPRTDSSKNPRIGDKPHAKTDAAPAPADKPRLPASSDDTNNSTSSNDGDTMDSSSNDSVNNTNTETDTN